MNPMNPPWDGLAYLAALSAVALLDGVRKASPCWFCILCDLQEPHCYVDRFSTERSGVQYPGLRQQNRSGTPDFMLEMRNGALWVTTAIRHFW